MVLFHWASEFKSYLPQKKIYLSWMTGWEFFRAMHNQEKVVRIKEMNTKEILSTYLIRKSWTSVWRICMWVLGLKGLIHQALLQLSMCYKSKLNSG